jgi:hypothetical protein
MNSSIAISSPPYPLNSEPILSLCSTLPPMFPFLALSTVQHLTSQTI